jgi:hypothetical protein
MSQQLHSSQRDNSAAINSEFAGSIKEMRHQSCIIIFLRGIALRVREQRPSECRIPVVHPTLRHEKCTIVEYGMSGSGLRTIDTITSEKVMWLLVFQEVFLGANLSLKKQLTALTSRMSNREWPAYPSSESNTGFLKVLVGALRGDIDQDLHTVSMRPLRSPCFASYEPGELSSTVNWCNAYIVALTFGRNR